MRTNKLIISFIIFAVMAVIIGGCKTDEELGKLAVLTGNPLREITLTTATGGGTISAGEGVYSSYGLIWSTKQLSEDNFSQGELPDVIQSQFPGEIWLSKTTNAISSGTFDAFLSDLTPNTSYYVRAFATNEVGTGYSNEIMFTSASTVTDIDENVYTTLIIGSQTWMTENLKVSRYNNGDAILNVPDASEWSYLGVTREGAYSWYNNNSQYEADYGKLYNWFAVADVREICPEGWHIPTDAEWQQLRNHLDPDANGNVNIAGGKMKVTGYNFWNSPNTGATNEPGFNAIPAGYRSSNGQYYDFEQANWWSATIHDEENAYNYSILHDYADVYKYPSTKHHGMSVRCVKD